MPANAQLAVWQHIDSIYDNDLMAIADQSVATVRAALLSGGAIDGNALAILLDAATRAIRMAGDHLDSVVMSLGESQLTA